MSNRRVQWSLVVLALVCLAPVAVGVGLLVAYGSRAGALPWALIGFFGAGVVVLARKAIARDQ